MATMSTTPATVALFENIHPRGAVLFKQAQFNDVAFIPGALEGNALLRELQNAHIIGIRSKTQLTKQVLEQANHLLAIGCFCIGTDQVDLDYAQGCGIPVFNAPYANTRSVAELVLGEIIMLMRRIPDKSRAAHEGKWLKEVQGATEVRGKTLGIVGYGHIGTQLSILAENFGMNIVFYDVLDKLALGNARKCATLEELLELADVVSLHVPSTPQTQMMIGEAQLQKMKPGALLINASRGNVVDLKELALAIKREHIGGAAIDVFPVEPANNKELLETPLQGLPNVILTPHIGGSTLEAQENIAAEVSNRLLRYILDGSTEGAVNMPNISVPPVTDTHTRFRHIHRNTPGILSQINQVFSSRSLNISAQYLQTNSRSGYVIVDIDGLVDARDVRKALCDIPGTIRAL